MHTTFYNVTCHRSDQADEAYNILTLRAMGLWGIPADSAALTDCVKLHIKCFAVKQYDFSKLLKQLGNSFPLSGWFKLALKISFVQLKRTRNLTW